MFQYNQDDPFYNTGFFYSCGGVGEFTLNVSGWVNAVIIKEDSLRAIFKTPITEPYMIHAIAGTTPYTYVYIKESDRNGFTLASCIDSHPIRFMNKVAASIMREPEGFFQNEEMATFLNKE